MEEDTQQDTKKQTKYKEEQFKWYIVASTSTRENRVAELIKQRMKANNFDDEVESVIVPTQEKIIIKKGKKETIEERLFPGYILIKMVPSEEIFHLLRNTEGVSGFVGSTANAKFPTPLNPKEVEGIIAYSKVKQAPTYDAKFVIGEAVKVADGPFKDFMGPVKEVNDAKGQLTVLLNIFGMDTPVTLDFLQVTKL